MATSSSFKKSSHGGALIAALLLVVITLLLTTGYVDTLTNENKTAKDNENSQLALYAADAGIQYALEYIRTNVTTTSSVISGYPAKVDATMFSSGNNNIIFVLQCCNGETCPTDTTVTSTCSSIACGTGTDSCMKYIATGLVRNSSNTITIAQRKVEAKISLKSDGNIFQWNEYYI